MQTDKRERLEEKGWRIGTVEEFLGLSPQEAEKVRAGVALGATPGDLARAIDSVTRPE